MWSSLNKEIKTVKQTLVDLFLTKVKVEIEGAAKKPTPYTLSANPHMKKEITASLSKLLKIEVVRKPSLGY